MLVLGDSETMSISVLEIYPQWDTSESETASHSVVSNSFVTPWIVAHQASLSMEFPRQEYWSGLPFPSPGDLPDPGIKPRPPTLQVNSLPSEPPGIN